MRVMYVLPTQAFGGAERQALLHIRRLPDYGVEVLPVVGPGKPMCRALEEAGVRDYVYLDDVPEETHSQLSLWGNVRYCARYFSTARRAARRLVELARTGGVDAIFAARTIGWIVSARAARRLALPLVVRQGSRPFHPIAKLGARLSPLLLGGRPTAMLSNCEAAHRIVAPLIGVEGAILPNAVDCARFDRARVEPRFRSALGLGPDVPVVGLAARPAPDKGLEFLAEVVGRLREAVPGLRLLIAGDYGWRAHYERWFAARGLAQQVTFLGHVVDVEAFYASCDVVVLSSRERSIEASPNALLEAMAMERPLVATNVGGIPEAVDHGVEGFLVDPDDVEGFAAHLGTLLGDAALRQRMGAAGRRRIQRQFGEAEVMRILVGTLQRVVEDARGAGRSLAAPG
ncbi:MAG: glycosyltransferase family 4 protein [Proteobacteria bacterium]|nr:glycosyltransferase family 4 protein [Pseudomonadota bacterium]